MTHHLLDSDTVIDALNGVTSTVAFLRELSARGDILCGSDVTLAEVYAGLHPQDQERAEQFLSTLTYLLTSPAAARQAPAWRTVSHDRARPSPSPIASSPPVRKSTTPPL